MWQFFESFNDPRWRQERRFLCIFLPIILLVTGVSLTALLWEKLFPVPETPDEMPVAPAGLSVRPAPATPEPTVTPSQANLSRDEAALNQSNVTPPKDALDFYNQAEALRLAGEPAQALADLQKARDLDRRNPLYANKILLLRMESGDNAAVFREIRTNLELNLTAGQADWVGGAAAVEAEAGNIPHCVAYLQILRQAVSRETFNLIVRDRFFDRYRKEKEFSHFLSTEPPP